MPLISNVKTRKWGAIHEQEKMVRKKTHMYAMSAQQSNNQTDKYRKKESERNNKKTQTHHNKLAKNHINHYCCAFVLVSSCECHSGMYVSDKMVSKFFSHAVVRNNVFHAHEGHNLLRNFLQRMLG
jgi:hypothetical protein